MTHPTITTPRVRFVLVGTLAIALTVAPDPVRRAGSGPFARGVTIAPEGGRGFFSGVALGLFGHPSDPDLADRDMAAIAALGATGIVLPVFGNSSDVRSIRIDPFHYGVPQAAYDRSTIEIARRAHARGLAFEILPIIRLERLAPGEWRGTLRPTSWRSWWRSYRRFILHQADVAQAARAEIFCVGSELGTAEGDRAQWARLIADVRRRYHGRVIYSANWDHYEHVTFWDLVDGIGLSAYYELSERAEAAQPELDAAWRGHRDRILAWARPFHKPLYLTEVGYPSQAGAAVHPWDYTVAERADPEAQARCFRAFTAAWRNVPELRGVTIWIWEHGKSGPDDPSYAIAGKPAVAIVTEFFRARR